ncbi:3-demethylubiquinone-9 3-methyltransferase [Thermoascus aurantiacus ATCC 26904]
MARPAAAAARTLLSHTFIHNNSSTIRCGTNFLLRHHSSSSSSSVSADELSHFSALASSWWDPMGPSRVLHLMNPFRHDFIAECLAEGSPRRAQQPDKVEEGLHYLDVGCGGGIFAESLARTIPLSLDGPLTATDAASILAIDPSTTLIRIAREHARTDPTLHAHMRSGRFRYENTTVEALNRNRNAFDVITLFEVLEHVESPLTFLTHTLRLLRPGGWLIGSTIARTLPSFLVNQVIAEAPWPLGVVPRGTHEWSKFVNPDELRGWVEEGLMRAKDGAARRAGSEALEGMRWKCAGVVYFPGIGWKMVKGTENWGNYFWAVRKGV